MPKKPLWTSPFIALSIINFMTFFGFMMLMPVFPLYLDSLGIEKHEAGLIMASFTVAVIPMRPVASRWLEKGRNRFCVVFGVVISVFATGAYWFAVSIPFLLFSRMLHGCGFGVSTVTYGTLVSNIVPSERRAEGMGYFGLSLSLAMCLGPWAGPFLFRNYGFGAVLVVSMLCILTVLPVVSKVQSHPKEIVEKKKFSLNDVIEKSVWFPAVLCSLAGVGWSTIIGFAALWAREISVDDIGSFFLVNAIFAFLVRLLAGKIADRHGYAYVIIPSIISYSIGMYLVSIADGMTGLLCAAALLGSGLGILTPLIQAWMINEAPAERRSAAMAMYYNSYDVGIGIGLAFWGVYARHFGFPNTFRTASIIVGFMLLFYCIYQVKNRKLKI